ncbi:DUF922 domain-containing protein [Undibacterium pigrum]|uniref:Putative secreted Zn-dependent protease n=1 Tax=Undibacterium pigrum TaxID=401470 RepID=A0A318J8D0_9BURK|nr:DUF922 domain-containing protein [Undibacterium pigrum]PXX42696.1 putative secreted Zn-dependent protease [Undibacterium pigrum]
MKINKLILLSLLAGTALARAEVTETVNYVKYPVRHEAGTSLLKALDAASIHPEGDKKHHGHTSWDIQWRYTYDKTSDLRTCKVKSIIVTLKATITLPELSSKDDKVIAQFNNYLPALKKHELGHLQIAQEAAKKIDQGLLAQAALPSCDILKTVLNAQGMALTEEAKTQSVQYDAQTRYGKTQGAYLSD